MNERKLRRGVLAALAARAQIGNNVDLLMISVACGAPVEEVARALVQLERAGLVHAARLRLTLAGLAVAAAVGLPEVAAGQRSSRGTRLARVARRAA